MSVGTERWLVTGASGLLGRELCAHLVGTGRTVVGVSRRHRADTPGAEELDVDLAALEDVGDLVRSTGATHVVHAAGITDVDGCELDDRAARRLHVDVAEALAVACRRAGAPFVYLSSDHLWDGHMAWVEEDMPPTPLNAYARSKVAGEVAVLGADPATLVVRTNFFGNGPPWRSSLSDWLLDGLARQVEIPAFHDVYFTPIAIPLLCAALVELVERQVGGTIHLTGAERVSKFEFARALAVAAGEPTTGIVPTSVADAALGAPRPRDMSLDTSRAAGLLGRPMPDIAASLDAVLQRSQVASSPRGSVTLPRTGLET